MSILTDNRLWAYDGAHLQQDAKSHLSFVLTGMLRAWKSWVHTKGSWDNMQVQQGFWESRLAQANQTTKWRFASCFAKMGCFSEFRGWFSWQKTEKNRVFLNPWFGEPVVCTLDSRGFRHFRGFRDCRESSTQLLVRSCLSCLCRFRRFRAFRRFRDRQPARKP